MCGILFYAGSENVETVFSTIKYRGPDSTTIKSIDGLQFCHHRLAIINTEGGEQPLIRGDIVLIANGEIYNYKSLTTSLNDCDAIIDAYLSGKLEELDGDFAFVLYEMKLQRIVTGRDPVGLKPLYIGYNQGGYPIAFGSEMKVLSGIDTIKDIKEHPINVFNTYSTLYRSGQCSLVKNVSCIDYSVPTTLQTIKHAQDTVRRLLTEAVKKRITHTERPYAFLCSGGIDSVITVAIAAELGIPLHVFTLSLDSGSSYDEIHADMFMRDLMKRPNIQYTKVKFSIKEGLSVIDEVIKTLETHDPNTIRAAIPMYLLAKYIRTNTDYKVILSGEGSDELFLGYNYFSVKKPTSEQAEKESLRLIQGLHSFDILRAERCFSSNGLELRVPFLDRYLISAVIQIPGELRLPVNGMEKQLLRKSFENLGINDRILFRQKERMSDGVGFSWVPSLINYCVSESVIVDGSLTTDMRMKYEKEYYKRIYDKYYTYSTILFRELPLWAESIQDTNLLNG